MKLELYANAGTGCWGGHCPAVYKTDRGTFVVQGKKVAGADAGGLSFGTDEVAVEIPERIAMEFATKLNRHP